MNTNDKRAAVLMLTASVIFGGLLATRVNANGEPGEASCTQQDNPLVWLCETMTIAYDFSWGFDDLGMGEMRGNPATPWQATFICNGQESGIFNAWVALHKYEDRSILTVEYTQLFCQAERTLNPWSYAMQFFCWFSTGFACRQGDLWNGYEIRIEQ